MKYPQLVSTRAVNAISDWLVSQLEQLGVEAPLIYSRLLLSLLHTSVQINDPIEFNSLETYLANRKGNKRNPPCDTDTLKKITAVQCLMETVSSEQEITKIENLVEELCEKLNDIENNQGKDEEEKLRPISPKLKANELEDPRKRYYRAFPALSKEMEDSVWITKRNVKSLTWPTGNPVVTNTPNVNSLNNTAGVKRKSKRRRNQAMSKGKTGNIHKNSYGGNSSPTWDTDFEGSWEMGRDLIKEFIMKQNNRNRSTSESAAYNIRSETNLEKRMKPMMGVENEFYIPSEIKGDDSKSNINIESSFNDDLSTSSDILQNEASVSHNVFITDEGYTTNEALTSLSEVDGTLNSARRLYERDVSNDSLNVCSSEQNDFAQFKAKFNSSVEALWKNDDNEMTNSAVPSTSKHQNLENFWTNYYNHRYDSEKIGKADGTDETDFFSMPANFDLKFEKANVKKAAVGDSFAPVSSVFLQNSIWSDNSGKNAEGDGFYANILGSSYKNESKIESSFYEPDDPPYSFNISKWSECSFETPFVPSSSASSSIDSSATASYSKSDLRENMLKNSYLYNYKQPVTLASNSNNMKNTLGQSLGTSLSMADSFEKASVAERSNNPLSSQTTVSLINHSLNSGFIEYSRIKTICRLESVPKVENLNDNCQNRRSLVQTPVSGSSDEENLLTSDRTHFRPIKQSYADGYEFDISNNLDEVKFERSKSGYLYLDSEKYLEYTRFDTFLSDDEHIFSTTPTSASSSSSLSSSVAVIDNSGKVVKNHKSEFALKFRVKQNEKHCQTDKHINDGDGYIIRNTHVRNINNCKLSEENCSDSESILDSCSSYLKDEVSVNLEQWSMAEIGKKCQDNNNTHTLWGMCSACNESMKSVPANRLLKDELNVEGDEIMSDLKYMQDLYIGSDWEDDDDTDCDAEVLKECELYDSLEMTEEDVEQDHICYDVTKFISDLLKPENAKSLANALVATNNPKFRKICPTTDTNLKMDDDNCKDDEEMNVLNNNNDNVNIEKYVGGLWTNEENIIWKQELKPINQDLVLQLKNSETSKFLEKQNWKYQNLADIWKNASTTNTENPCSSNMMTVKHIDENQCNNGTCTSDSDTLKKNSKNLISLNISHEKSGNSDIQNSPDIKSTAAAIFDGNVLKINENNRNSIFGVNKIINRFDRKRRHSASQNVDSKITDGDDLSCISHQSINDFCENMIIGSNVEVMTTTASHDNCDFDKMLTSGNDDSPATIITCKYWATPMDTKTAKTFISDKGSHFDGISALAINPSSILKQVAVAARPLTR